MKKTLNLFAMLTIMLTASTSVTACKPEINDNNSNLGEINVFIEAKDENNKSIIEDKQFLYGFVSNQMSLYEFTTNFEQKNLFEYSDTAWGHQLNTINNYNGDFDDYYWGIFSNTDLECVDQADFSCNQGVDGLVLNPTIQNHYWFALTKINSESKS